jgi:protein-L-isoaspartate O-methyltransferase
VVAAMIGYLEPWPGPRGLVVGTGTGWHTGLLAASRPDAAIVSVDIDPQWTAHAAAATRRAGVRPLPRFATGDGLAGWPQGAPYDWLCATCSVDRIPAAWPDQVRPGGVLLTPWYSRWTAYGMALMTVTAPGRATGRFIPDGSFMRARHDAASYVEHVALRDPDADGPRTAAARLDPELTDDRPGRLDAAFALGLMLPGYRRHRLDNPDPAGDPTWCCSHLYIAPDGKSWAEVEHAEGAGTPVLTAEQYGPDDVWTRVEDAYEAWVRLGSPEVGEWRIAADTRGTRVWVDAHPGQVWELPGDPLR